MPSLLRDAGKPRFTSVDQAYARGVYDAEQRLRKKNRRKKRQPPRHHVPPAEDGRRRMLGMWVMGVVALVALAVAILLWANEPPELHQDVEQHVDVGTVEQPPAQAPRAPSPQPSQQMTSTSTPTPTPEEAEPAVAPVEEGAAFEQQQPATGESSPGRGNGTAAQEPEPIQEPQPAEEQAPATQEQTQEPAPSQPPTEEDDPGPIEGTVEVLDGVLCTLLCGGE